MPFDFEGFILPGHFIIAGVRKEPSLPSPNSAAHMLLEPPLDVEGPVNDDAPSSET